MNNKGFTLIELIATIALLAIISIISFVSINSVLKQSKVNDCENLVKNIKSATKEYVSDKRYNLSSDGDFNITAQDLLNANYLSSNVADDSDNVMIDNPFEEEHIDPSTIKIKIELKSDYTVKNVSIEAPAILNTCTIE